MGLGGRLKPASRVTGALALEEAKAPQRHNVGDHVLFLWFGDRFPWAAEFGDAFGAVGGDHRCV